MHQATRGAQIHKLSRQRSLWLVNRRRSRNEPASVFGGSRVALAARGLRMSVSFWVVRVVLRSALSRWGRGVIFRNEVFF